MKDYLGQVVVSALATRDIQARQAAFRRPGETAWKNDGTRHCANCGLPFNRPNPLPNRSHNSTHAWNGDWFVCPPAKA